MRRIELTQGKFAVVSDEDYEDLSRYKWQVARCGAKRIHLYAVRTDPSSGGRIFMHRQVAGVDGLLVDHINGDGLDNRRENLRPATYSENALNIHAQPKTSTGVRSVFKNGKGFTAKPVRFGRRFYLGFYKDIPSASRAVEKFNGFSGDREAFARLIVAEALVDSAASALEVAKRELEKAYSEVYPKLMVGRAA